MSASKIEDIVALNRYRSLPILLASMLALIGFAFAGNNAGAQAPASVPPTKGPSAATAPDTLADALPLTRPLFSGVAIAVDAERQHLPKDAAPVRPQSTLDTVAGSFDDISRRFGAVYAVAPGTMVVLNAAPSNPNIYDGMPVSDCLALLLGGLSDSQWQQVISDQGMPVSELTTDQQQMFVQLLPEGKLRIAPWYSSINLSYHDSDIQDLSDQLPQCSLRLTRSFSVELPDKDNQGYYGNEDVRPADSAHLYKLVGRQDYGGSQDTVYGVPVRAVVPNVPKSAQFNYRSPVLQPLVPLSGLKTVDDLIRRIGQVTRVEIYADPRLGSRSLTVIGPASAAPATDLLRALALCVTGTYRQVGPAFVLTDDIVGLGTRKMTWFEFEMDANAERAQSVEAAANGLFMNRSPQSVSWFGNPIAYSPDQEKPMPDTPFYYWDSVNSDFLPQIATTFDKLTPAQQQAVLNAVDDHNGTYTDQPTNTNGTIRLNPEVSLQIIVPSLSNPVDMNVSMGEMQLFQMPDDVRTQRQDQMVAMIRKDAAIRQAAALKAAATQAAASRATLPPGASRAPARPAPPKPALRLAALVEASTASEVDSDVAAIKKLGFGELWLVVFNNGILQVPGSPLSEPAKHGSRTDILTEAIKDTQGTGIKVYPVLDLFYWGSNPPADATDLNILGENLIQAQTRLQNRQSLMPKNQVPMEEAPSRPFPGVAVASLSTTVQSELTQIVSMLAHRQGVAGLVWEGTDPPGYDPNADLYGVSSLTLGYQEATRLAFLRKDHADPVDVYNTGTYLGKANTDLPEFGWREGTKLNDDWQGFRNKANVTFLESLYTAATSGLAKAAKPEIILAERQSGSYALTFDPLFNLPFSVWDGRDATLFSQPEPGQTAVPAVGREIETVSPNALLAHLPAGVPLSSLHIMLPAGFRGYVYNFTDAPLGETALLNQMASHGSFAALLQPSN